MDRYDRGWAPPFRYPGRGYGGGYDRGYAGGRAGGYGAERGIYGDEYPAFGGYPGGRRGMHYGGELRGRYDRFAREPFMPEEAYRRHPEYARPPRPGPDEPWRRRQEADFGDYQPGDGELADAVRDSLRRDPWLSAERVRVSVDDGVVTLAGELDDFMEARYAWDDAWETEGVRGVVSRITVRAGRPAAPPSPATTTAAGAKPEAGRRPQKNPSGG